MTEDLTSAEHRAWCRWADAYEAMDFAVTGKFSAAQPGTRQQRIEAAWEELRNAWRSYLDG